MPVSIILLPLCGQRCVGASKKDAKLHESSAECEEDAEMPSIMLCHLSSVLHKLQLMPYMLAVAMYNHHMRARESVPI